MNYQSLAASSSSAETFLVYTMVGLIVIGIVVVINKLDLMIHKLSTHRELMILDEIAEMAKERGIPCPKGELLDECIKTRKMFLSGKLLLKAKINDLAESHQEKKNEESKPQGPA
jgi:hypothetical protein